MKKIKVLQLPIANARGGITQYALQNWKAIDKNRFQFDFATRSKALDFANDLMEQGCKIHYLTCSSEENEPQFIREIHQILDEGYDAVHLHTSFWKGFWVEKLAIERKCPIVIIHSHSTMVDILDEKKRNEYITIHNLYKNTLPIEYATNFCACSRLAADWLFGEHIPRARIQILKNAIDVPTYRFSPAIRKDYREKLGLHRCFVLGHVGRFVYQKNHEMLIEIFRQVYQDMPHARLMLIGYGELEKNVQQQVKKHGLEHAVLFPGKTIKVPQMLQAMDIFLLPSRFEGLPIVLVEAQAAGLKCLASAAISREIKITPDLDFFPNSVSAWVEHILQVSSGYDRKNNDDLIAQAGFDLRRQIKLIEKLYTGKDISRDCPSAADEF
ncbi:MAG: glycosyltransferase [Desulforhabdus sp.]|jgi:glycosyltransferase involved in cell wall biosynthesis|nr:glycosyltransferase [Desulforhabdus sp.]